MWRPDGDYSAIFQGYEIKRPVILGKACTHKLERMCVSHQCKEYSLHCQQQECKNSYEKHPECRSITLKSFTNLMRQQFQFGKEFLVRVLKAEDAIIGEMLKRRECLIKKTFFAGFEESQKCMVHEIFQKNNSDFVKGKDVDRLFEKSIQMRKIQIKSVQMLQVYEAAMIRCFAEIEQVHKTLFRQHQSHFHLKIDDSDEILIIEESLDILSSPSCEAQHNVGCEFESNHNNSRKSLDVKRDNKKALEEVVKEKPHLISQQIVEQIEKIQPQDLKVAHEAEKENNIQIKQEQIGRKEKLETTFKQKIDSRIFIGQQAKYKFLHQQLGSPSEIQLLFRASQHKFSAAKFHQFCDNIPDTVTIVRTEFHKTIAAYTPLKWQATDQQTFVTDPSQSSFLLQLELNEKMTLIKGEESIAIVNNKDCGPIFGENDLFIVDKCNQKRNSYTYFPFSYNCDGKYKNDQKSYTAISGATDDYHFGIVEYEVFKVIK